MGSNTVEIKFTAKDLTGGALKGLNKGFKNITSTVGGLSKQIFSLKGLIATAGVGVMAKSFLDAANTSEQLQIRLGVLLGSVSEGNRLFKEMGDFASKVPFEYEEIMESATMLAGILKGGTNEIKEWMPLIGDLAATTGLTIKETTEQVQRMLSAGAASADKFRERGVLSMLGFQAGVSYSANETKKILVEAWKEPTSQFAGATIKLATSWQGLMSMMSDKWFQFRMQVMDAGLFDFIKSIAMVVDKELGDALSNSKGTAQLWSDAIIRWAATIAIGMAKIIDAVSGPMAIMQKYANDMWTGFKSLPGWVQQLGVLGAIVVGKKGVAALAMGTQFANNAKTIGAWWTAYQEDKIGFVEWFTTMEPEAKARLAEISMMSGKINRGALKDAPPKGLVNALLFGTGEDGGEVGSAEETVRTMLAAVATQMEILRASKESEAAIESEGNSKKVELLMEDVALRYGITDEANLNAQERDQLHNAQSLSDLQARLKNGSISEQAYRTEKEKLEVEHLKKMKNHNVQYLEGSFGFGQAIRKRELATALSHGISMLSQAKGLNSTMFRLWQAAALAKAAVSLPSAVMSTWERAGGYPWGIAPAALMAAKGAVEIRQIANASLSQAHGGLTNVPRDETFLLRAGERVVQPEQNKDLTQFLAGGGGGGGVNIETLNMNISVEGRDLVNMDETEIQELIADKFIPGLNALSDQGVRLNDIARMEQL